jgi:hypothetical protein
MSEAFVLSLSKHIRPLDRLNTLEYKGERKVNTSQGRIYNEGITANNLLLADKSQFADAGLMNDRHGLGNIVVDDVFIGVELDGQFGIRLQ